MCKLYVGTADDLHGFHDAVCVILQSRLQLFGNGQHGSRTEGISGVHAHGIDVLDEANGDEVIVRVTNNLELELLPAKDRLLYQHLANQAGLQASRANRLQLVLIVNQSAACAAHGVSGTKYNGIAELVSDRECLVNGVCNFTARHLDAQLVHGILEFDSVLAALDGIHLHADDLYVIFVQNACTCKLCAEI